MKTKERKAEADFHDSSITDHKKYILWADRGGNKSWKKVSQPRKKIEECLNKPPKKRLVRKQQCQG